MALVFFTQDLMMYLPYTGFIYNPLPPMTASNSTILLDCSKTSHLSGQTSAVT